MQHEYLCKIACNDEDDPFPTLEMTRRFLKKQKRLQNEEEEMEDKWAKVTSFDLSIFTEEFLDEIDKIFNHCFRANDNALLEGFSTGTPTYEVLFKDYTQRVNEYVVKFIIERKNTNISTPKRFASRVAYALRLRADRVPLPIGSSEVILAWHELFLRIPYSITEVSPQYLESESYAYCTCRLACGSTQYLTTVKQLEGPKK